MEFHKLTIKEIVLLLEQKRITAKDLVEFFLNRIDLIDPKIKACISVFHKEALERALEVDKMIQAGFKSPLLGIPYLVKDNIMTKGFKTTAASRMLEDYIAPYDARVIDSLNKQGAIMLGKTNLDEFAHGASTENSSFFTTRNPWDTERVPGGSSGGSAAAVAAGLCVFALGSDTGGSIRQPASFCGVSGYKPSYSLVSRFGLIAMTSSTDVIGPIAKNVEDISFVMSAIAGFDKNDLSSYKQDQVHYEDQLELDISSKTMAFVPSMINDLDASIQDLFYASIERFKKMGVMVKEIELKYSKYAGPVYYIITPSELSSNLARLDGIRYGFSSDLKSKGKSESNLNEIYLQNRGMSFGREVKRRIILGTYALSSGYFDAYYKKAIAVRDMIRKEYDEIFSEVDFIITPTSPHIAFKVGEQSDDPVKMYLEDIYVTGPSLAGLPAISIPAGFESGMPFGVQIYAQKMNDAELLNISNQFQSNSSFHKSYPEV